MLWRLWMVWTGSLVPMDFEFERERLVKTLTALGNTADEVANTLKTLGVTGVPCVSRQCVVARHLEAELSMTARVGPVSVDVWLEESGDYLTVNTSPVICWFIRKFDRHEYPELVNLELVNLEPASPQAV